MPTIADPATAVVIGFSTAFDTALDRIEVLRPIDSAVLVVACFCCCCIETLLFIIDIVGVIKLLLCDVVNADADEAKRSTALVAENIFIIVVNCMSIYYGNSYNFSRLIPSLVLFNSTISN